MPVVSRAAILTEAQTDHFSKSCASVGGGDFHAEHEPGAILEERGASRGVNASYCVFTLASLKLRTAMSRHRGRNKYQKPFQTCLHFV